jgi:hypothetical protein
LAPEDKDELIEGVDEDYVIDLIVRLLAHYSGRNEITAEEREIVAKLVRMIFLDAKISLQNVGTAEQIAMQLRNLHDAFLKRLSGITRTNSKRRAVANGDYQRYRAMDAELGTGKLTLHQRALRVRAKLRERGEKVASCRTIERALRPKEV